MTNNNTNIIEIFSSIQGEGPYIGCRQVFVRFALCNLNCNYCDTKFKPEKYFKAEIYPGSESFKEMENPVSIEQLIYEINRLNYFPHHSLSLTGGEPLLNSDFLNLFLEEFNKNKQNKNFKIYLETNGVLYTELEKVISNVDIISMDFKLESSTGKPALYNEHREFINIAQKNNKEIFTKVVLTSKITSDEIKELSDMISNLKEQIPVILQLITTENRNLIPEPKQLLNLQEILLKKIMDVRIIPQTHKYLNLL